MTKAKTVTTKTITEEVHPPETVEEVEAIPVIAQPIDIPTQEEQDLKNFFEGLGGSDIIIKISKFDTSTNRPRFLQDTDLEGANESFIQNNWGEGKYLLRAYKEGRVTGSKTVLIGPSLKSLNPPPAAPVIVNEKPGMDPVILMQLEQMREESKTNREILMKLIESSMGNNNKSGAMEIAEVMAILKPVITPQPAAAGGSVLEVLNQAIPLVRQLIDLGANSGGGEKPSWLGMVKDIGPDVLKTIGQIAMTRNAPQVMPAQPLPGVPIQSLPNARIPAADQQPVEIQGIDPDQLAMLRQAIGFLKSRARKNSPPETFIDYVMETLDEDQSMAIAKLLDRSYEEIAIIDPEILSNVYRPWFESFFRGLKDALSERDNAGGEPGNDPDTAKDAGAIDSGSPDGPKD